jgi:hypothetical protein
LPGRDALSSKQRCISEQIRALQAQAGALRLAIPLGRPDGGTFTTGETDKAP